MWDDCESDIARNGVIWSSGWLASEYPRDTLTLRMVEHLEGAEGVQELPGPIQKSPGPWLTFAHRQNHHDSPRGHPFHRCIVKTANNAVPTRTASEYRAPGEQGLGRIESSGTGTRCQLEGWRVPQLSGDGEFECEGQSGYLWWSGQRIPVS